MKSLTIRMARCPVYPMQYLSGNVPSQVYLGVQRKVENVLIRIEVKRHIRDKITPDKWHAR